MKHIIFFVVMCILTSNVFAYDGTNLRINVTGNVKNTQYLCVSGVGCVNIAASSHGRTFPITSGEEVSYIFLANGKNYRMYPQALPSSCNVTVNENQTLVVSGRVAKAANDNVFISQLRCSVVNG